MTRYDKVHECLRRHKREIIDGVRDAIKDVFILAILLFIPLFILAAGVSERRFFAGIRTITVTTQSAERSQQMTDHEEMKEKSTKDKTTFKPALLLALCGIGVVFVLIATSMWNSYKKDSHEISEEEATELVRKGLAKKYGDEDEFDVSQASRKKTSTKEYYSVDVHSKNLDITFSVTVSTDGTRVYDKYEFCKYNPQINKELESVSESQKWYTDSFRVLCADTKIDENSRTIQEYKADKVTLSIMLNVTPVFDDPNLGESLYQYLAEIHDMGYNQIDFSIQDDIKGKTLLFKWDDSRPYMSDIADKEGFIKRTNRWLESSCQCDCESCRKGQ